MSAVTSDAVTPKCAFKDRLAVYPGATDDDRFSVGDNRPG